MKSSPQAVTVRKPFLKAAEVYMRLQQSKLTSVNFLSCIGIVVKTGNFIFEYSSHWPSSLSL